MTTQAERDAKLGAILRKWLLVWQKEYGADDIVAALRDYATSAASEPDRYRDYWRELADALEAEAVPPAGDGCYKVAL